MKQAVGKTLVAGGGIAGIRAALDLAQAGYQVVLAEQSDHLGGMLSQLDYQFPTVTCGMCRLLPVADRDPVAPDCLRRGLCHERIETCLSTDLESVTGEPGSFTVSLQSKAAGDRGEFVVLVVDDEAIVRDSMKEWLAEEGYRVKTADSATAALDLLADTRFEMMLTDIKMPGMDGVQLLERARSIQPDLAVVMMTAYAAVDSAVAAMKQGAREYLVKPFDPDVVLALVDKMFQAFVADRARVVTVDAVILAAGATMSPLGRGINAYGYGRIPGVVTSLEFERMLSHAGPGGKKLLHPTSARPVHRIAWFQCAGSRDLQHGSPYCSSVCCRISVKQALMAKQMYPTVSDATIFYMDLRTPGKLSESLVRQALEHQVTLVRARPHSLARNAVDPDAAIQVTWADAAAFRCEKKFDVVVLAGGRKPDPAMAGFAKGHEMSCDEWGFVGMDRFDPVDTGRPGMFACGEITGPHDIRTCVIQGSAAALRAIQVMQAAGRQRQTSARIKAAEPANGPRATSMDAGNADSPRVEGTADRTAEAIRLKKRHAGIILVPRALVVGGGIAGMTAALNIADQGFEVDLVEAQGKLGGNLTWLSRSDEQMASLLEQQTGAVTAHERIQVHLETRVAGTAGRPGQWVTWLAPMGDDKSDIHVSHGVVVLAVGGHQADPEMDTRTAGKGVYTQQDFQQALDQGEVDSQAALGVAMVQCHGSRDKDREYCSRVCCPRSLAQALFLTRQNPDTRVTVFYRDIMTLGVAEAEYTRARQAGVVFVPYDRGCAPTIVPADDGCTFTWTDNILGRDMEMDVDYAVVAPGVVSGLDLDMARIFGAGLDRSGFFDQADIKWRPVEAVDPRVLACGLCLAPGSLDRVLTDARAVAARAVILLGQGTIFPGPDTATLKTALCSLCRVCIDVCPFRARYVDMETDTLAVDPLLCQGCGMCAAACPSGAAVVPGVAAGQMLPAIQAALAGN